MFSKAPRIAPRMSSLSAALVSVFVVLAQPSGAIAQIANASTSPVQLYQIEPGPLVRTLDAIASASGRRIVFDRQSLSSAQAPAVRGTFTASAALSEALTGSGYIVREDAGGALAVAPVAVVHITARDEAEASFKASRSDTATRSGADLHYVPGSVTLITAKVLETQQATNLQETLRNVSGVNFEQTPQGTPTFSVRGFNASSTVNGVSDHSATSTDVFGVERIEVLKGPQAILSGGESEGGGVNIVLKKPSAEIVRDLTLQYGSNADRTVAADLSGPIDQSKRLTYRVIGSAAKASRTEAGYKGRENNAITPSIRWKDDKTDFIASASYNEQRVPMMRYTFARRDGVILPAPTVLLAHPNDGIETVSKRVGYQLEHAFSPTLRFVSRLQLSESDTDLRLPSPAGLDYADGAADDAPDRAVLFFGSRTRSAERTLSGDHYLRYSVRTGGILHRVSAGFNHSNYKLDQLSNYGEPVVGEPFSPEPIPFIDIRQSATEFGATGDQGSRQRAVYLQDMAVFGNWTALINLRRNAYTLGKSTVSFGPDLNFVEPESRFLKTTSSAGVVYRLSETASLYASYAEGFAPNYGTVCGGNLAPPSMTKNKEAGAKFNLMDSKLSLTASAFSLSQSNYLEYNFLNNCFDLRAAQKTNGLEFDVQGRPMPGLDIIFNYTFNRIKDVGNSTVLFAGFPKHKTSAWAVYRFQQDALKGWGAGLGLSASSAAEGSNRLDERFEVPGQSQLDASVFYDRGPWSATFGIKNLADRRLYGVSRSASFVPILPGRAYMLTVKRSFN